MSEPPTVSTDTDLRQDRIVRRHLDLPKYLDLLRSRSLYLRRADGFTDRFEGALTPWFRASVDEGHRQGEIEYDAEYFYRRSRVGSFVSCWNLDAKENMALWQLYGGVSNSVAVISTIGKLVAAALRWQENVLFHKVTYINYFKSPDMIIGRYTDFLQYKHEAYDYEREVRVIVPRQQDGWEKNPEGIRLPLGDLNDVLQSLVVAPEASSWFYDLIEDVTRKYKVASPVLRSELTFLPK